MFPDTTKNGIIKNIWIKATLLAKNGKEKAQNHAM